MNTNDLNTALYEKMAAEQDKFRDWLKSQPPEEVLNHAYEYTIREDIVMAMEELELTDTQAQALLESPSPLADVYRYFEKLETGYMDVIRDSIENRADDVCRAKEELRTTPVYPHSAAYAREHGELEQYRASNNVNLQCKESIEAAVREHFDGMYLSHDAAKGVIETMAWSVCPWFCLTRSSFRTGMGVTPDATKNGLRPFPTIIPKLSVVVMP